MTAKFFPQTNQCNSFLAPRNERRNEVVKVRCLPADSSHTSRRLHLPNGKLLCVSFLTNVMLGLCKCYVVFMEIIW